MITSYLPRLDAASKHYCIPIAGMSKEHCRHRTFRVAFGFRLCVTGPDPAEHRYQAIQADNDKQPFAAACQLGHAIQARLRLQYSPWDPAGAVHVLGAAPMPLTALTGWHGLDAGRQAQTAFVDGSTFSGILLPDSAPISRMAKGLVLRAQWAVDQWPEGWRNHEVLGGALVRAGDYQEAVRELSESQKLRGRCLIRQSWRLTVCKRIRSLAIRHPRRESTQPASVMTVVATALE